MSITFPLALPTNTGFKSLLITPDSCVAVTESPWTYDQQVQRNQGQRWQADVQLPIMNKADAAIWQAFFLSLNGMEGTFLMGDPAAAAPLGVGTGTPLINGAGQSGQVINTDGWTHGVTGILKANDRVQFGTGATARLYRQLVDVNSDGSGNAALTLWPRVSLANVQADNAAITILSAQGVFRMAGNIGFSADSATLYNHSFKAMSLV